jgi:hypothetical protein
MNEKTVSPWATILIGVVCGIAGFWFELPAEQESPLGGLVAPHVFPERPSIFPSREAAGEMTINGQVALTWVRVSDRTNIYLAKKDKTDRVIEIVATPTSIAVVSEGRRVGDVGTVGSQTP